MASGKWYYSKEQLENSPSRKDGIEAVREFRYRQDAADLIHYMGEQLNLTNAIINSAVVYMHRFYVFHSFVRFHRYPVAATSIFLAAKSESMPKKLESVIRALHACIYKNKGSDIDIASKAYQQEADHILYIEHVMIQTLGFELDIEHAHAYVLKFCQEIKANKDFAQACYFLATESLETTTMCLRYSPKVIASFCIFFASKLTNWEIFENQGRNWFYPDNDSEVSLDLLEKLAQEFKVIFDHSTTRWRQKIMSIVQGRNSPQLTATATESKARSSLVLTDSRLQHQSAGSVPVPGQMKMPQSESNLLVTDISGNLAQNPGQPLLKCLSTSLPSTFRGTESKDSFQSAPKTIGSSVSIFNPDVPDTEVQKILSRLVPRQNQSTPEKNGGSTGAHSRNSDLTKVRDGGSTTNSVDSKPSMIGDQSANHSKPSLVVKISRDRINGSLGSKLGDVNRPPLRLTIKIPKLNANADCNSKNLSKSLNKDCYSPPTKKIRR